METTVRLVRLVVVQKKRIRLQNASSFTSFEKNVRDRFGCCRVPIRLYGRFTAL